MEKISILIADDHRLMREAWSFILNLDQRFNVVAECSTGEEAVELVKQLRPDIILMDINLPEMGGIEATGRSRKFSPRSKVLAVSVHNQPVFVRQIMQKGAMGYVTKNSSSMEMIAAILEIQHGNKYICQEIKDSLADQVIDGEGKKAGINSLTKRELEIISLIRLGNSSKEIASALSISAKTVEVHRQNILKKLNMRNTSALVNFISNSIVSP